MLHRSDLQDSSLHTPSRVPDPRPPPSSHYCSFSLSRRASSFPTHSPRPTPSVRYLTATCPSSRLASHPDHSCPWRCWVMSIQAITVPCPHRTNSLLWLTGDHCAAHACHSKHGSQSSARQRRSMSAGAAGDESSAARPRPMLHLLVRTRKSFPRSHSATVCSPAASRLPGPCRLQFELSSGAVRQRACSRPGWTGPQIGSLSRSGNDSEDKHRLP